VKWFRVMADDGRIVGISEMSEGDAIRNLPRGQLLIPHDPAVPLHHQWRGGQWVEIAAFEDRAGDYLFMRRSGYDLGAQVGALMKVVEALLSKPDLAAALPEGVMAEFDALAVHNAALKAAHPKP